MNLRVQIEMNGQWIDITDDCEPFKITIERGYRSQKALNAAPSGSSSPQTFTAITHPTDPETKTA